MFWNLFKLRKKGFIYKILDESLPINVLGVWEKHLLQFTEIVGYSATGSILLFSPKTLEYLVFYPAIKPGNNSKNYGVFQSLKDFESNILQDESFPEYCLYPITPADLKHLERKLGKLEEFQIYFPKLDPALGGSLALDNFGKGDVWVRTDTLGQNRGIE